MPDRKRVGDSYDNEDVQSIMEELQSPGGGRLIKCRICGVQFDNLGAFEGHVAAGHISINSASEENPSGLGHLTKTTHTCDVCGRGFPTREKYETYRLQH